MKKFLSLALFVIVAVLVYRVVFSVLLFLDESSCGALEVCLSSALLIPVRRYNHVFHVSTGTLYATPYSDSGVDVFEGCVPVCDSFSGISDDRLARLLTECVFLSNAMQESSYLDNRRYQSYLYRRLYGIQSRVMSHIGYGSFVSIMNTLRVKVLS